MPFVSMICMGGKGMLVLPAIMSHRQNHPHVIHFSAERLVKNFWKKKNLHFWSQCLGRHCSFYPSDFFPPTHPQFSRMCRPYVAHSHTCILKSLNIYLFFLFSKLFIFNNYFVWKNYLVIFASVEGHSEVLPPVN